MLKKPELICPAGDWASLRAAVENGADSVYFGLKGINMRYWADNFDILEMQKIMNYLHNNHKKGYLVLNTIIKNSDLSKVKKILDEAKRVQVDAIILWDMSVLSFAKELDLPIHLSTQASVSNIQAVIFYAQMGIKRIVLARECTLFDIREIIKELKILSIDCEIETFIHGAMCISYSGRCFLSYYSYGKSANQGQCVQPCRREYNITDTEGQQYVLGHDYVLSPKDLNTIHFVDELIEAGIHSFKIEGRIRSPEYLKVVTTVYREAIEAYYSGTLQQDLKQQLNQRLEKVYNRGFSTGFYFGQPRDATSRRNEHLYEKVYLGQVAKYYKKINVAEIRIQNDSLSIGQEILFIGKHTAALTVKVQEMQSYHKTISIANKGDVIGIKIPFRVDAKDKVFLWRKK